MVDGGELEIEWRADSHVLMTGPVATSFIGEIDRTAYPLMTGSEPPGGPCDADRLHPRPRHDVELLSFGCRLNAYESEVMRDHAATLSATVVVNTCAVTAEAERQARQAIRRARANILVRASSSPAARPRSIPAAWARCRASGAGQRGQAEAGKLGAGRIECRVRHHGGARDGAHLVTEFAGRARAFVQVQQGCDHRCTFCIIPFGRGPNRSVPIGAVVSQVRALVEAGYQEVVLTGVDIASYGADLPGSPRLGQMVRRLLALVPDLPRLRLSSLDPAAIDDGIWRLLGDEARLMPHMHLSLQAGSDLILKRMKRRHLRADAVRAVERARRAAPGYRDRC